jgi:hypothetical protein
MSSRYVKHADLPDDVGEKKQSKVFRKATVSSKSHLTLEELRAAEQRLWKAMDHCSYSMCTVNDAEVRSRYKQQYSKLQKEYLETGRMIRALERTNKGTIGAVRPARPLSQNPITAWQESEQQVSSSSSGLSAVWPCSADFA